MFAVGGGYSAEGAAVRRGGGAEVHNRGVNARFLAPDARATGDLVALPDDEAQHIVRVLRLAAGAAVRVFDGHGHEFDAVIEVAGKPGVTVRVGAPRAAAPEARLALTLAPAVLKGDKMDDVVRDAVMMGVAAIQPIVTERTEVSLAVLERGGRQARWQRIAVSSAKQCGRAVVPVVAAPIAFEALLEAVKALTMPGPALLLAEPAAAREAVSLTELASVAPREATLVVGPEGGWTPAEIDRADVCRLVTLGGRTLRADAAPMVAIAALFAVWKEY